MSEWVVGAFIGVVIGSVVTFVSFLLALRSRANIEEVQDND